MPVRRRPSDLTIVAVAGVLMVVLAAISFLISPPDSSPRAGGSSYSAEPDGTKAAYLVLKELGFDLQRSFEPIAEQRLNPSKAVLILASPTEAPSTRDVRALRDFVDRGGIVVAFGPSAGLFLPGVAAERSDRRQRALRTFQPALPGPLTAGAPELSARARITPSLDDAYLPVYGSARDVGVITGRFGDGRVIWCLDDTPIQNSGIDRAANVNVVVNAVRIAGPRTVSWDEHYHGERRSLWSYLAGTPLPWGAMQLGIMALATLAGVMRRRGPQRSRLVEPRTSPLEFVETMGSLYERAGATREAIESARGRLRRRLAGAAGLSIASTDEQLVTAAATRVGIEAGRTREALGTAAEMLRRGVPRSRDARPIVAALQELAAIASAARTGSGPRTQATRHDEQGTRDKGHGSRQEG
jgi:hypothetical protein